MAVENHKRKLEEPDLAPDEARDCPICLEPWSNNGKHRIACLACGHLFGLNCIENWIQKERKSCPTCNAKAKKSDIRSLYFSKVSVVDSSEKEAAMAAVQEEKQLRRLAESERARAVMKYEVLKQQFESNYAKLKQVESQLERLRSAVPVRHRSDSTPISGNAAPHSKNFDAASEPLVLPKCLATGSISRLSSLDLGAGCDLGNCEKPVAQSEHAPLLGGLCSGRNGPRFHLQHSIAVEGSRVFTFLQGGEDVVVSYQGEGGNCGLKKISLIDSREQALFGSLETRGRPIRDVQASYHHPRLVLSTGLDSMLRVSCTRSANTVLNFDLTAPGWSCAWGYGEAGSNNLFAGLQNGSVMVFDIRQTRGAIGILCGSASRQPVHSIVPVPARRNCNAASPLNESIFEGGRWFDKLPNRSGLLLASMNSVRLWEWDVASHAGVESVTLNSESALPLGGSLCTSLSVCHSASLALVALRTIGSPAAALAASGADGDVHKFATDQAGLPPSHLVFAQDCEPKLVGQAVEVKQAPGSGATGVEAAETCVLEKLVIDPVVSSLIPHRQASHDHYYLASMLYGAPNQRYLSRALIWRGLCPSPEKECLSGAPSVSDKSHSSELTTLVASGDETSFELLLWAPDRNQIEPVQRLRAHSSAILDVRHSFDTQPQSNGSGVSSRSVGRGRPRRLPDGPDGLDATSKSNATSSLGFTNAASAKRQQKCELPVHGGGQAEGGLCRTDGDQLLGSLSERQLFIYSLIEEPC